MDVANFNDESSLRDTGRVFVDPPYGQWSAASAQPPPALADLVVQFWEVQGFVKYSREKIIPRGTVELIVNLGLPHQTLDEADLSPIATYRSAWLSGLHDRALIAAPTYDTSLLGSHLVGASLTARGALELFGLPGRLLANGVVELSDLFGRPEVEDLREQLHDGPSSLSRFRVLARYLQSRRSRLGRAISPSVTWSLNALGRSSGKTRVEDLCQAYGVSRKHLGCRFQEEIGLPPKRYARLLKFSRLIEYLMACESPNWAELALACGYYDQPHLIREFKAFSGSTPTEFLRERCADGQSVMYE